MDVRSVLSIIAVLIGFVGYFFYLRNLFRKKTKPHAFSWFVWGILTGIAFFAQLSAGGGIGALVMGITSLLCFLIAGLSYFHFGIAYATKLDWFCLITAILGVLLWKITQNPLSAVVMVMIADLIAYIPTIRKGHSHPNEETASLFYLEGAKYFLSLFALEAWNQTTLLYPVMLVIANTAFATMLVLRRRVISS